MIRLIAVAFALAVATSAQATPLAPLHQSDGMITQVREACGAGRVRINGARRGQNHQAPCPPSDPQVCAMERRRLRLVLLRRHRTGREGGERPSNAVKLPGQNSCRAHYAAIPGGGPHRSRIAAVEKSIFRRANDAIELKLSILGWQRRVGVGRRGEEK